MGEVELQSLLEQGLKNNLSKKDRSRLLMALWKRFWNPGLRSFRERLFIASHTYHPLDEVARKKFIEEEMAKWQKSFA